MSIDNQEQEREMVANLQQWTIKQGGSQPEPVSIQAVHSGLLPRGPGPLYAVALRASWPSSASRPAVRVILAQQHNGRWWFFSLSEMWIDLVAEAATAQRVKREG